MEIYWQGNRVFAESAMPMTEKDGTLRPIRLLYPIDRIESVCNAEGTVRYEEERDYVLRDGELHIPTDSRILVTEYATLYPTQPVEGHVFDAVDGGYVYYAEDDFFHHRQIAVTYTHTARWNGPLPTAQGARLPQTLRKLKNGEELRVVFHGDSVMAGYNSTAFLGYEPHVPTWPELVVDGLRTRYPQATVCMHNEGVGGTTAAWGEEQAATLVCRHEPHLVVIRFGGNDDTFGVPPHEYGQQIRSMMAIVREQFPLCEFLLVSSFAANAEAIVFQGPHYAAYAAVLNELAGDGVAVADMYAIHQYMLTRKQYRDMSGNHVNHVNDFLALVHAQLVLETMREV